MMQCPDCGHDLPEGEGKCVYCGAAVADTLSADHPERSGESDKASMPEKLGECKVRSTSYAEEATYFRLDELPPDLQERVADVLKERGRSIRGDEGFAGKDDPDSLAGVEMPGQDVFPGLSFQKSRHRRRLHPVILFGVFLAAVGVTGFVMWLMM